MESKCEYSGYDSEFNIPTCKLHQVCRYSKPNDEDCYVFFHDGPLVTVLPIKEKIDKFFKEKEVEYILRFKSTSMMLLEFDNMCLILWFGEQEVSTLMDLDNPKCKFVSELLETLSTEELSINLINGTKYTSSVLLTNDLNMKDEFLLNKVIVSSAKKQYSSTIKLQEESIKIPNDIKGIDKKSNSDKGCEYRVDKINHCMLNTPKGDINICDCSSKDNCKIYKKWG